MHLSIFFLLSLLLSASLFSWEITPDEAQQIGNQIFSNECSRKQEKLLWWNDGENFASLGIGHFIWYPKGTQGPFEEAFPSLLAFLNANGALLPAWLKNEKGCPWRTKQEFLSGNHEAKKKDLQQLLSTTIALQTAFMVKRLETIIPRLFSEQSLLDKVNQIAKTSQGKYALVDYLNFKGDGSLPTERYCGRGWGLRQVLEEMPANAKDPLTAFAETAKMLLKRRVENAPVHRHEERWLPGWLARVDTYTQKSR
jgi:hypothetical protein